MTSRLPRTHLALLSAYGFVPALSFVLLTALTLSACDDDDPEDVTELTAPDFSADLTEGAAAGTVIGQLMASGSLNQPLTYTLVSADPAGALAVSSTGEGASRTRRPSTSTSARKSPASTR